MYIFLFLVSLFQLRPISNPPWLPVTDIIDLVNVFVSFVPEQSFERDAVLVCNVLGPQMKSLLGSVTPINGELEPGGSVLLAALSTHSFVFFQQTCKWRIIFTAVRVCVSLLFVLPKHERVFCEIFLKITNIQRKIIFPLH